ncbi:TetR/AcrR family transcriptional regulator [Rhodococcus opacus]|uniref:TetR/AcrR family transcriptional regulator n=1 Tax=Rhodococcus opacus TaxID=37919 RepID=UPI002475935C|nr:TetR/AcrR family transcriptional regulator [Rhodococcus opacus]MDH6292476.1 AcrR family transcriptional regulator [Rhodococcus opacus]
MTEPLTEPDTPTRRPRERVRRQVIGAARELIETGGYAALTVDALVAASGISKKTVYRWWDNRADVALDTIFEAFGEPDAVRGGPALDRVRHYLEAEARYLGGPAGPVLAGVLADAQHRPALAATVERRYFAARRDGLGALLHEAVREGGLSAGIDPDLTAAVLLAPLHQALLTRYPSLDEDTARRVVQLVMHGISDRGSA